MTRTFGAASIARANLAVSLYRSGLTLAQVGAEIGVSKQAVHGILVAAGVPRRKRVAKRRPARRPRPEPRCGSLARYARGCRCERCRGANAARYRRDSRERRARGLCWNCRTKAVPGLTHCEKHRAAVCARARRAA